MKLFGTDGIRGVANTEITPELCSRLAGAAGSVISEGMTELTTKPFVVIGRDTRISGRMMEGAIAAGFMSVGYDVLLLGVTTTPAVPIYVTHTGAAAGIMISASHNPFEFNGIKMFDSNGLKISDSMEDRIEKRVAASIILGNSRMNMMGSRIGSIMDLKDEGNFYLEYLIAIARKQQVDFRGIKIAMDCSNGSAYQIAPELYTRLGAEVHVIGNIPDGININKNVGSTNTAAIKNYTKLVGADIGFSYDGDADRLIAVDEEGEELDGDSIMFVLAQMMSQEGRLNHNTIVATVMSNVGLEISADRLDFDLIRTKVGDKNVLRSMIEGGYNLGGEQSGHIIMTDYSTTGDGILTSLMLLTAKIKSGQKTSELGATVKRYPQVIVNAKVPVRKHSDLMENEIVLKRISELETKYSRRGRVLVRPSGTEPLIRVMIEGTDTGEIEKDADELVEFIELEVNRKLSF